MSNREIFIDKLRQLSKEEMLERYIALLNTEKLTDYVADLEAKFADLQQEQIKEMQEHQEAMELADKTIKDTETQNKRVLEKLELIVSANQELEQKLAENEKDLIIKCRTIGVLVEKNEKNNQDKISFAVEQLEKVKENLIDRLADIDRQFMEDLWDEEQYARMCWENWDTEKFIDNQIKQLKEMK